MARNGKKSKCKRSDFKSMVRFYFKSIVQTTINGNNEERICMKIV